MHGTLKSVLGEAYCGPTAIAAITGAPVAKVERIILDRRRQMRRALECGGSIWPEARAPERVRSEWFERVVGVDSNEIAPALRKLGWCVVARTQYFQRVTFANWRRMTEHERGTYVVYFCDHVVAVSGELFCDSLNQNPIPLSRADVQRCLVQHADRVLPLGEKL